MKLICLPHSGASSVVFYKWLKYLPSNTQLVALDYPGHGTRSGEELIWNYADLVEDMYATYKKEFNEPFFLFGHSIGALVAFGLAHRLEADKNRKFQQLLVCGHEAPHVKDDLPDIAHLEDPEFLKIFQERYGELPSSLLKDAELYQQFVPLIRVGVTVSEEYVHKKSPPLRTPLSVFVPEKDKFFSFDDAREWKSYSHQFLGVKIIPGDHVSCMSNPTAINTITKHGTTRA